MNPRIRLRDVQALRPASFGARTHEESPSGQLSPLESLLQPEAIREECELPEEIPEGNFYGMVGRSPEMLSVFATLARIASYPVAPLLLGEPGSGKSCAAKAIHRASDRSNTRMISFDCRRPQEIPLENILFGEVATIGPEHHAPDRPGLLELAHGGSLYLREVSALPIDVQVKLLRCLEAGEIRRVGCAQLRKLDVRIITSSSKDLSELCTQGEFRGDLLYRLNVGSVRLPALREVPEEIAWLSDFFLEKIAAETGQTRKTLHPDARRALRENLWLENVRGLHQSLRHGSARAQSPEIQISDLYLPDVDRQSS